MGPGETLPEVSASATIGNYIIERELGRGVDLATDECLVLLPAGVNTPGRLRPRQRNR